MQTSKSRLQLTYYLLQVVKFGMILASPILAVGGGVSSWQFTLGAFCSLVAQPTTQVTFAAKSLSDAKLYWCIIIM